MKWPGLLHWQLADFQLFKKLTLIIFRRTLAAWYQYVSITGADPFSLNRFGPIALLVSVCLAAVPGVFPPVFAQSLPRLNAQSISNRMVGMSWPYTNAGFALQESMGLQAVSNWQASTLTPAFNSNSAFFSVSAAATNATRFFRLEQPADLRGIYVYVGLETATNSPDAVPLRAALNEPGVDGMLLVGLWSSIETNLNQYNWNQVDRWMDYAASLNKEITFSLRAGDGIPAWLYLPLPNGAGATELNFSITPKDGKMGNCQPDTNAIPWEPAFLTNWSLMLSNLSAHLKQHGTYRNLTLLRLTGINRTSDELRLPAETPDTNSLTGTGLDCVSNAPAIWQANGYPRPNYCPPGATSLPRSTPVSRTNRFAWPSSPIRRRSHFRRLTTAAISLRTTCRTRTSPSCNSPARCCRAGSWCSSIS